ncbi:MAG: hypothetical protein ACK5CE_03980 [Actinomycetes bacterium]|jgi:hypothetical protein
MDEHTTSAPTWPDPAAVELLSEVWIPVGVPGYSGASKAERAARLDERFGAGGWRLSHVVRGQVVPFEVAILEYEEAYRQYLMATPVLVRLLATQCGNVYDDDPSNVNDDSYVQPHTAMNHYQDISVRRVIAELVDDPAWPVVVDSGSGDEELFDVTSGRRIPSRRARGFSGDLLLQMREPTSPLFALSPAVVPVHDPALITSLPGRHEWYHGEGCAHLSVEAFWQMSKVVEVRYDRFLALGDARANPLDGL